jgi:hypothetical protein
MVPPMTRRSPSSRRSSHPSPFPKGWNINL